MPQLPDAPDTTAASMLCRAPLDCNSIVYFVLIPEATGRRYY